jgi:hypothetical protein
MLAYSSSSQVALRLSTDVNQQQDTTDVHVIVHIRDLLQCVIDYHLPPVRIRSDPALITQLLSDFTQTDLQSINNNPTIQLLATGNPNVVGQVLTSISQLFNHVNKDNIDQAVSSKTMLIHHCTACYLL